VKIAILGATSHIAKNLIYYFLKDSRYKLFLFSRRNESVHAFLVPLEKATIPTVQSYDGFSLEEYDAIINCVGIADPRKQKADPYESFLVTERFDNLTIDYIKAHKGCRYINFSSGAVFGTEFQEPVGDNSTATFRPNALGTADCYRIAKLNAETKHRCLSDLPIVDIRVYSFFSRYIDLDAGFMLSEAARCILDGRPFRTNASEIVRDYIAPNDLFSFVSRILAGGPANAVVDMRSTRPVRKSELLESLAKNFGLVIEMMYCDIQTVSGMKSEYYSTSGQAESLFGFEPTCNALKCVGTEMEALLACAGRTMESGMRP